MIQDHKYEENTLIYIENWVLQPKKLLLDKMHEGEEQKKAKEHSRVCVIYQRISSYLSLHRDNVKTQTASIQNELPKYFINNKEIANEYGWLDASNRCQFPPIQTNGIEIIPLDKYYPPSSPTIKQIPLLLSECWGK